MEDYNFNDKPDEFRFFIDSSKLSLKAVLLHIGNEFLSVPIGHAAHIMKSYFNMKLLLIVVKYHEFQWQICGDFKVIIVLLLGMWLGYTE